MSQGQDRFSCWVVQMDDLVLRSQSGGKIYEVAEAIQSKELILTIVRSILFSQWFILFYLMNLEHHLQILELFTFELLLKIVPITDLPLKFIIKKGNWQYPKVLNDWRPPEPPEHQSSPSAHLQTYHRTASQTPCAPADSWAPRHGFRTEPPWHRARQGHRLFTEVCPGAAAAVRQKQRSHLEEDRWKWSFAGLIVCADVRQWFRRVAVRWTRRITCSKHFLRKLLQKVYWWS